jgi:hypothetical protein
MDGDGDFAVAWRSTVQEPSGYGIYAQRYDSAGTPLGNELHVNTYTTSDQFDPYVAMDADGDFIISWTSTGQDGSSNGVYAQRFADAVPPRVTASDFLFDTLPQRLRFTFSEDVAASLSLADVTVQALPGGPVITPASLTYDAATFSATIAFSSVLDDANYRGTIAAPGVSDDAGNALDGDGNGAGGDDFTFDFFFLNGDANRDRTVDLLDFNILALNFGQSNRNFSQGDFNYDGTVDLLDFNILASRFGQSVGPGTFSALRIGIGKAESRIFDEFRDDAVV